MPIGSDAFTEFVRSHDPLVSVVVPAYEKVEYLQETLGSVLEQSWRPLEVVVVDDGSSDGTGEAARALARNRPSERIRVLEQPNRGVAAARNSGIRAAEGRVVTVLDADDLMRPSYLEKAVRSLREGADLVCCDVELFGAESGEWIPPEFDRYALRYNNSIPTLVTYDRALWARAGRYRPAFAFNEDWDFFVRCSEAGMRVARIRERLFRYRVTKEGLASRYIKDTWEWSVALMATANEAAYSIADVLGAHESLKKAPPRWLERHERQSTLHPEEWLPRFWLGLGLEGQGKIGGALVEYQRALELSKGKNWQPLYRVGYLTADGDPKTKIECFHLARTLRPDVALFVRDGIERLLAKSSSP